MAYWRSLLIMAIQFKTSGTILFASAGSIAMGSDCCCDTPEYSEIDCQYCEEGKTPLNWTAVFSEIIVCTDCHKHDLGFGWRRVLNLSPSPNGVIVLLQTEDPCIWEKTENLSGGYRLYANDSCDGDFGTWNFTTRTTTFRIGPAGASIVSNYKAFLNQGTPELISQEIFFNRSMTYTTCGSTIADTNDESGPCGSGGLAEDNWDFGHSGSVSISPGP